MKSFIGQLLGGVLIILIASGIGLAHNAVRERPIKLIQTAKPIKTAQKGHDSPGEKRGAEAESPPSAEEVAPAEGSITTAQMKELFDAETAVVIDARAPDVFAKGHIPGAINIPYDRLPDYYDQLVSTVPMDEPVVTYCWSPKCDFSDQLATELQIMGFEKIMVYTGGWDQWVEAGHPTATGMSE